MNKFNYLFDACVSHRNTLKAQRSADEFFSREETKFFNDMANRKHQHHDMMLYPIETITPLMTEANEKAFCILHDIKWRQYGDDYEPFTEGRDNFYWILLNEIENIAYAQDVYDDDDPHLEVKREYLSDLFDARYDDLVPQDIIRSDFCSHNDI